MNRSRAIGAVAALFVVAAAAAILAPPIPQDPAYHRMADGRTLLGIPNALNVLSNAAFVLVGGLGLWVLRPGGSRFVHAHERWAWGVFFGGLVLTGVGSAYYHLAPANDPLVWDRLPLAAALMGLFAAVIVDRISVRSGLILLAPLVAIGLGSVLWWQVGEARGRGDLRLYALVQFYPVLAVPVMVFSLTPRYTRGGAVMVAVAVYAFAKVWEYLDAPVFRLGAVVSGHTLKHLTAAAAGGVIVWMLATRRPLAQ